MKTVSIVGIVGLPARYGGFETLAENLCRYHASEEVNVRLDVYCSSVSVGERRDRYQRANLRYVALKANGISSVIYDIVSIVLAVLRGSDVILLLGVSGAVAVPFVRVLSGVRVIVNVDGIEWKRAKWNWMAQRFLKLSELVAIRFSHVVVADNQAIAEYVAEVYGKPCEVITYGGDHVLRVPTCVPRGMSLPAEYALALSRIEPENNVEIILQAFSRQAGTALVYIGNWGGSAFGRNLKERYSEFRNIVLLDPIYDLGTLRFIRERAALYVHGHSAGGTNPSLVEIMHFACPVIAFDCAFNRITTENQALYFRDSDSLQEIIRISDKEGMRQVGERMRSIATSRYTWDQVSRSYFDLMV